MAEHTLSCGCKSKYFGIQAEWDTTSREGNPAVAYGVLCERHWHELGARRPWSGLNDDEIKEIIGPWGETPIRGYTRKLFDQIEAKLKEKNCAN
jgi:hypothetical protein